MLNVNVVTIASAFLRLSPFAATAQQSTAYEGTVYGTGTGKCTAYRMTIQVALSGNDIKGTFQQEGRTQRHFEAKLDPSGAFKANADVGGGGSMQVSGTLRPDGGAVLLNGYCRFETRLTRR